MRILTALLWMSIAAASLDAEQVFGAGDEGVIRPRILTQVGIEYSDEARRERFEGEIALDVVIGTDGSVRSVDIIRSFGAGMDEQAVKALKQWKFKPAEKDGEPVAFKTCVTMHFKLL